MAALSTRDRPVWLDFRKIDARCTELGYETETSRANLLGVERSFLNRLRRGAADITLGRVFEMARRLHVTPAGIIAAGPKPSPPPTPPKPPSGPQQPRPPAGPKQGADR